MSNLGTIFADALFHSTPDTSKCFSKNYRELSDCFKSSTCITIVAAKAFLVGKGESRNTPSLRKGQKKKSCNWMSGDRGLHFLSRFRPIVRLGNVVWRKSFTLRRRCGKVHLVGTRSDWIWPLQLLDAVLEQHKRLASLGRPRHWQSRQKV